ncbi:hypothetical protein [Nocardioides sp.]|uniref:hypothetical protein n=1 Tax=Nocardioides sp. TaxID=35761 RepID=UPI003783E601
MKPRQLVSLVSPAVLVLGLAAAVASPAQAALMKHCPAGGDYLGVKNVSCAEAKKVLDGALDHVDLGQYAFTVRGFKCKFPDHDYFSGMTCRRTHHGKKQVIEWMGD